MSKDLSAKYYWDNKEKLPKRPPERYQSLLKKEKEKSGNIVVNDIKLSQKIKNKG